jgi:hypothetical protein
MTNQATATQTNRLLWLVGLCLLIIVAGVTLFQVDAAALASRLQEIENDRADAEQRLNDLLALAVITPDNQQSNLAFDRLATDIDHLKLDLAELNHPRVAYINSGERNATTTLKDDLRRITERFTATTDRRTALPDNFSTVLAEARPTTGSCGDPDETATEEIDTSEYDRLTGLLNDYQTAVNELADAFARLN